jgi:DHA2 family multidrug resistance protein
MMAFFGINVVFPLWLQIDLGYTATWAGLASAPVGVLAFLMAPVIGANIQRLELRAVVTFAFIVFAVTSFWFASFDSSASFGTLVLPRFVMGIGIACFFIPLNQMYLSGLNPDQVASASGLANFCRTLASSVSTAATVTLWQHRGEYHHAVLTEHITPAAPAATGFLQRLEHGGFSMRQGLDVVDQLITREALTLSVNDVYLACAVLFLAMIPLLWLARPPFGNAGGAVGH